MEKWIELENICVHSPEKMIELCQNWALQFWQGHQHVVLLLDGDLGAGKTTFIKGIATHLGITQTINSPTFNLLNEYTGTKGSLFHYDLYRISSAGELFDLDFIDRWSAKLNSTNSKKKNIHAIEWWQRATEEFTTTASLQKNLYQISICEEQPHVTLKNTDSKAYHINPTQSRRVTLYRYGK